jgi:hypothetical protein
MTMFATHRTAIYGRLTSESTATLLRLYHRVGQGKHNPNALDIKQIEDEACKAKQMQRALDAQRT